MKRRPLIINTARGGLVVEDDLETALDEGLMSGILGEGWLEFVERLTGGGGRCDGTFRLREDLP